MRHVAGSALLAAALAAFGASPGWTQAAAEDEKAPRQDPFAEELDALVDEYKDAQQKQYDAYRKASTDEERGKALQEHDPGEKFLALFQDFAERAKGTDSGAAAWTWVFDLGVQRPDVRNDPDRSAAVRALDTLVSEYVQSPALERFASSVGYASWSLGHERVERALRRIIEKTPHRAVLGKALFSLAGQLGSSRVGPGDDLERELRAGEAREIFERLADEFGDVAMGGDRTLAQLATSNLFELDHLQVGMVAPDFESVDQDGVSFKVSDYRGRVVVLGFWGYW